MREIYRYEGRGRESLADESCYHIECGEGRVLTITELFGHAEFILGYCRSAIVDEWGICCIRPFRRVSDLGFTRSWAEAHKVDLMVFRRVRLNIAVEEKWMQLSA
jgi:hypothetical protein